MLWNRTVRAGLRNIPARFLLFAVGLTLITLSSIFLLRNGKRSAKAETQQSSAAATDDNRRSKRSQRAETIFWITFFVLGTLTVGAAFLTDPDEPALD